MDMNQAIRDFFGTASMGDYATERVRYNESLATELLSLLVEKGIINKDEAKGVIKKAKDRAKRKAGR